MHRKTLFNMEILYLGDQPKNISEDYLDQLISLVTTGGQVEPHLIDRGVRNAFCIGLLITKGRVIAGCCLKNPIINYRNRVFKTAEVKENPDNYQYELGYIVTHPHYEGKGYCSSLLSQFFPTVSHHHIYATTRKPAMSHILSKFGFYKNGKTYKDGLELLLYDGKVKG